MKKIFLLTALFILQMSTAFASVEEHIDKGVNYEMSYPIVYTNNKAAQDKINQDIYHYIAAFRNDFNAGKFLRGSFSYQVRFEDDNYISLTITDARFNPRYEHGNHDVYGVVYDKQTGRKLPLSHFLHVTVSDLQSFYRDHFYTENGKKIYGMFSLEKVSDSYYLLGNGGIALIYQPYVLASYAEGATTIRLSAEEVDYFNRKNRNLC